MKILQIGKFHPIRGGVEKVMWDLTAGLSARGIHCDMLCADSDGKGRLIHLNGHGSVICTPSLAKLKGTMIAPDMVKTLRRIAADYDIIHVHHPDPMAGLALRMSGFRGKVVLHWHSDILRQRVLLQAYRPLQHWLVKRADRIVTTSPNYLEGSQWLESVRDKGRVLPIGVTEVTADPGEIQRLREKSRGRKVIFSLGRLVPYKGYSNLVEAAALLPDDYLVVIGGEGPLEAELKALAEQKAPGKVVFPGRISEEERNAWFFVADAFCLPSIIKTEAFGIVLIEAMSTGLPLVATNIPGSGTGWVNAHGESGLNAEPGDPQGLAEAILGVAADAAENARYREGAKRRWGRLFTAGAMIDGAVRLYEEILGDNNPGTLSGNC